jgi:Flp pilus assembly pilin Flp
MEGKGAASDTSFIKRRHSRRTSRRSDTMAKLNKQMALKKSRGQGMTEYIIIVALIAIAAIGVITLFGDNIKALFGMSADALAGDTQVEKRTSKSQGKLEKKKLTDFAKENSGY